MLKYIQLKDNNQGYTHIKVTVYYNKGCDYCSTSISARRGYIAAVVPIKRNGAWETTESYTGCNCFLLEVKRKSNKAEAQAAALLENQLDELLDYVCEKNSIEILEN